ncbi:MAG TPA: hypothetical protein VFQ61_16145 [Polyangiaceae bacterium]|nr:hypothetical protein [Polyangiaceae bacterium]
MNPADPVLEAAWKRVLDHWDEEQAHTGFLDYCRLSGRLVEAAVRYRGMTGDRARAELAEKKLKAVALLALTQLETTRTEPRPVNPRRSGYVLISFVFLLGIIGLLAYLRATR